MPYLTWQIVIHSRRANSCMPRPDFPEAQPPVIVIAALVPSFWGRLVSDRSDRSSLRVPHRIRVHRRELAAIIEFGQSVSADGIPRGARAPAVWFSVPYLPTSGPCLMKRRNGPTGSLPPETFRSGIQPRLRDRLALIGTRPRSPARRNRERLKFISTRLVPIGDSIPTRRTGNC
jgi:hypothetical protein